MPQPPEPPPHRVAAPQWRPRAVATVAGLLVTATGAVELLAWHLRWTGALQLRPGTNAMQYVTAAAFVLLGLALVATALERRLPARTAALAAAALAVASLLELAFDVRLVAGRVVEPFIVTGSDASGRMSPNTAVCVVVLAAALAARSLPVLRRRWAETLTVGGSLAAATGTLSLFGYASGVNAAYEWGHVARMALLSAAVIVVCGAGTIAAAWLPTGARTSPGTFLVAVPGAVAALALLLFGWYFVAFLVGGSHPVSSSAGTAALVVVSMAVAALLAGLVTARSVAVRGRRTAEQAATALAEQVAQRERAEMVARQWRDAVEHAEWGIVIGSADGDALEQMNPAFARMHGCTVDELLDQPIVSVFAPEERAKLAGHMRTAHEQGHHTFESVHLRKDGSSFPVLVNVTAVRDASGAPLFRVVNVIDITERLQMEQFVRGQQRVLEVIAYGRPLADALDGVLALLHARLPGDPCFVLVNVQGLAGFQQVVTGGLPDSMRWLDDPRLWSLVRRAEQSTTGPTSEPSCVDLTDPTLPADLRRAAELARLRRLWSTPVHSISAGDGAGSVVLGRAEAAPLDAATLETLSTAAHLVAVALDRDRAQVELVHQALHDPLTGLPNRRLFYDRLEHALGARSREPGSVAVLFLDLDRFKLVNDSLGHEAGDEVLRQVADRLHRLVRASDTLARLGGDEFALLVDRVAGPLEPAHVAGRVLETLRVPVRVEDRELRMTASIGVVTAPWGSDPSEAMRHADVAMYRAKAAGGGRLELFDERLRGQLMHRLDAEQALHLALERGLLTVAYQPIVSLNTGEVVAFEALARWDRAEQGVLPASEFIDTAEETGLVLGVDALVLEQACADAVCWSGRRGRAPRVQVNLSAHQLANSSVVDLVDGVLARTGLDARRLCVELTETAMLADLGHAAAALRDLRSLGVRVAVDDFGTGYASLGYLDRLPVDTLKIDQLFVQGLPDNGVRMAMVEAIARLGLALGVSVTAEGIESPEQLRALRMLGVRYGQGFLFARPMAATDVDDAAGAVAAVFAGL